jgi:hypothetical protein
MMGAGILPSLMKWLGIILICVIILGAFYFIFMFFQYSTVVYKLVLGEMDDKGKKTYFIKKISKMKARRAKIKGVERFKYLWYRFTTPPIPEKNIVPHSGFFVRDASFVYEVDKNVFLPSALSFSINSPAVVNFTPLPYDVTRAAVLELQEIAKEFQDPGWMAKYGTYLWGFLTVLGCLILAGAVIWMTYKYIGGELGNAATSAKSMADAFREGVTQRFTPG